jgi:hypothetical protein
MLIDNEERGCNRGLNSVFHGAECLFCEHGTELSLFIKYSNLLTKTGD